VIEKSVHGVTSVAWEIKMSRRQHYKHGTPTEGSVPALNTINMTLLRSEELCMWLFSRQAKVYLKSEAKE